MASFIDWERLAREVGALGEDGGEQGGDRLARRALEEIIGTGEWHAAVDHYVAGKSGRELIRSVLWLIHPWAAMQRCQEVYQTSSDPDARCAAVELLRAVADRRVLPWVRQYLHDADVGVQEWGAGIVDQLLWSELMEPEEAADLLDEMSRHPSAGIRARVEWIRSFLQQRELRR